MDLFHRTLILLLDSGNIEYCLQVLLHQSPISRDEKNIINVLY